eukprot:5898559-Amphidinium_carterae.1
MHVHRGGRNINLAKILRIRIRLGWSSTASSTQQKEETCRYGAGHVLGSKFDSELSKQSCDNPGPRKG